MPTLTGRRCALRTPFDRDEILAAKTLLKKNAMNTLVRHRFSEFAVKKFIDCNCAQPLLGKKIAENDFDDRIAVCDWYLDPRGFPDFVQSVDNTDDDGTG